MKKVIVLMLFVLAVSGLMIAQNASSTVDVLGAHNNQGRGCAGCHAPHSGSFGSGNNKGAGKADAGSYALWGQDASPLYGATIAFGDSGKYTEVLPTSITSGSTEVGGILLCLSCHDGNVTSSNMMTGKSYEQSIGLLTNTAYGNAPIPTLLGNDGTTAGNYTNDHPVGVNANISTTQPGLVWSGTPFSVNAAGKPFVACTTCHNQHVMTIYTSSVASPIAGDGGGKYYNTFFFVNGPYNPNLQTYASNKAPSTTQFCRQCHFGEANEANNTNTITTQFQ